MKFSSFVDIKNKKIIKELSILKDVLSKQFEIKPYLEENDSPYIYVKSKNTDVAFDGVRVYKIGSNWAYRIQNESDTEPYGKAYPIDLEKMFEDLVSDMSEEEAGDVIAKALIEEFSNFFSKSSKVQKELDANTFTTKNIEKNKMSGSDSDSPVVVGSNSGDFSNSIYK